MSGGVGGSRRAIAVTRPDLKSVPLLNGGFTSRARRLVPGVVDPSRSMFREGGSCRRAHRGLAELVVVQTTFRQGVQCWRTY